MRPFQIDLFTLRAVQNLLYAVYPLVVSSVLSIMGTVAFYRLSERRARRRVVRHRVDALTDGWKSWPTGGGL